ncbi:hypothetical protein Tco_1185227 [Tanacetum coccineum]
MCPQEGSNDGMTKDRWWRNLEEGMLVSSSNHLVMWMKLVIWNEALVAAMDGLVVVDNGRRGWIEYQYDLVLLFLESQCPVFTSTTTRMAKNEVNEIRTLKTIKRTANPHARLLLNNNQFTILQTILLKTLNIPPPERNSLPETEEKQLLHLLLLLMIQNLLRLLKMDEMSKEKEIDKLMALISLSIQ